MSKPSKNSPLKESLRKFFKLDHFQNKIQEDAVKTILKREQDVMISMQTGSGKSLCYQLPGVMEKDKITIVFSSSLSAIKDQLSQLKKSKICAKSMDSKISKNERGRVLKDLKSKKPDTRFLFVTPDQASSKELKDILESLHKHNKLTYFAVDEAQCISKKSQEFKKDYSNLGSLRPVYPSVPWIVLTAIVSMEVVEDVVENLNLRKPIAKFKKPSFRDNIFYDVIFKNKLLDFDHLTRYVTKCLTPVDSNVKDNKKPCGIIYCRTEETVDDVAKELTQLGIRAYHSGMKTEDRTKVLEDWSAGVFPVITATASSLKGVVKRSVRFVVHWDVPLSMAGYYKEAGRAGRDGQKSYCRIYYCKETMTTIDSILKEDINNSDHSNTLLTLLKHSDFVKMCAYCETVECRHKLISNYFGEDPPDCRENCDVCQCPSDVQIALDIFNGVAPTAANSFPIRIKDEPGSPPHQINSGTVNGQSIKMEQSRTESQLGVSEFAEMNFRPPRNISPANTIVKEEGDETNRDSKMQVSSNHVGNANLSDELFAMQTQPPGNVSPARTIIKDEPNRPNETDLEDNKTELRNRLLRPPPAVSPAETVIEEEPFRKLHPNSRIKTERRSISPHNGISSLTNTINVKIEPVDSELAISGSEEFSSRDQITPREQISPRTQIRTRDPTTEGEQINRRDQTTIGEQISPRMQISPRTRISPREQISPVDQISPRDLSNAGELITPIEQITSSNPISPKMQVTSSQEIGHEDHISQSEPINHIESITPILRLNSNAVPIQKDQAVLDAANQRKPNEFDQDMEQDLPRRTSISFIPEDSVSKQEIFRSASPTGTIITEEPQTIVQNLSNISLNGRMTSPDHTMKNERIQNKLSKRQRTESQDTRLSLSPTGTVIKDERKSPERGEDVHMKNHEDFLENVSNYSPTSRTPSPNHSIKNKRYREHLPRKRQRSSSRESRRSLSPAETIIKEEPKSPKIQSNSRFDTKKRRDSSNNSFASRTPSPKSSHRSYIDNERYSRKRQRSRSNERYSKYNGRSDRDYRKESSLSSTKSSNYSTSHKSLKSSRSRRSPEYDSQYKDKRLHGSSKSHNNSQHKRERRSGKRGKSHRNSSGRESSCYEISSDDGHRSPQPSTSRGQRGNTGSWSGIRFSVSPDASPSHATITKRMDDSDSDYGWEDPAPPKVMSETPKKPKLEDLNPKLKEKMLSFNSSLQTEFDLDVIEADRKELFRAIQESIEAESKRKLNELDTLIQKKKDDYVRNLYGTDNFDSWDDDPALSNVEAAKKLKPYKSIVTQNVPLLEKMNLKHVINASRLTPARQRNELVFHGHIKQIETEFQGQELPPHFLDALKQEKSIIADLVKKYLMPYYDNGRLKPPDIFAIVARKISHVFYDRNADETIIKNYIDNIFQKYGFVTKSTNLEI